MKFDTFLVFWSSICKYIHVNCIFTQHRTNDAINYLKIKIVEIAMPVVSIFSRIKRFFSGVKNVPKSILKKRAQQRAMIRERIATSQKFFQSIQVILSYAPADKQEQITQEFKGLAKEFNSIIKHYKSPSDELDRKLETVMLKSRAFKIYVACMGGLNSPKYDEKHKKNIQNLLEECISLREVMLHHEVSSGVLIEYRTELKNLEDKSKAQLHGSIKLDASM